MRLTPSHLLQELGKKRAKAEFKSGPKVVPSNQFVRTYFAAFARDPIFASHSKDIYQQNDDSSPFLKARRNVLASIDLEEVIPLCDEELTLEDSSFRREALLLKATFLLIRGSAHLALSDLNALLEMPSSPSSSSSNDLFQHDIDIRINALIKRGGLRMQVSA